MNITFLVGNGFDISLGLHTSYANFYDWYFERDSQSDCIRRFKEEISSNLTNWSDFEIGLGKYAEQFSKETANEFLECYGDAVEAMGEYLNNEQNKLGENWINNIDVDRLKQGIRKFYQEVSSKEQEYIKNAIDTPSEDVVIHFITFNYTNTVDLIVKKLSKELLKAWSRTNTSYKMYVDPNVIHVNGTLNYYPLLGVDNAGQISNEDLKKNEEVYTSVIKSNAVVFLGENWYQEAQKLIQKSRFICVFGMSLGETDGRWWKQIIELLTEKDRRLILFIYTKNPPSKRNILERKRAVDDVVKTILKYGALTNDEKKSVKERILPVFNTEKFLKVQEVPIIKEVVLAVTPSVK